jgi:hypothetical protein
MRKALKKSAIEIHLKTGAAPSQNQARCRSHPAESENLLDAETLRRSWRGGENCGGFRNASRVIVP